MGGNDKRLVLYKMFVGLLQDVGCSTRVIY